MCTGIRFVDDKGNMYFGRNLDWESGYGQYVTITPRAFKRTYAYDPKVMDSLAVIGICIVVNDIPLYFDCANEKGLAIAGLNFPGYGQYEEGPVDGKINLAAYEFPLWVASNCASVDEAEEALKNVAIVAKQVNEELPVSLLHWIIGDAKRSIVVEYMADGMHIHHDDADVLTNQPTFDWHMEHLRSYMDVSNEYVPSVKWGNAELTPYGSGGLMHGLPGSTYSPDRFVRAAFYNGHYPVQTGEKANIARLFRTLQSEAMIFGAAKMGDGNYEYTTYTSGYSAATQTYYMNIYDNLDIRTYPMSATDIDGSELYKFEPYE